MKQLNKVPLRIYLSIITLLFIIVRALSVYRSDIGFDSYDSPSYFSATWINPIRMPFLSYTYTFLNNFSAIVLLQTVVGIFSWVLLAFSISSVINNTYLKIISVILVLSLGITSPIVGFDSMILSESLTFSIFNCIMAISILYIKENKLSQLLFLLSFIILYAGIKQSNAHISAVIVALFFVYIISNFNLISNRQFHLYFVLIAFIISCFFIWLSRQNEEISGNVEVTNIIERTFDDYPSQSWYLGKGFPGIAYQTYSSPPFEPPIGLTRSLPQVKAWEMFEKKSPIELYALQHPLFLLFGPLTPSHFIPTFTDNESVLVSLARGYRLDNNYEVINLKTSLAEPFFLEKLDLPSLFWWSGDRNIQKISLILFCLVILFFYAINRPKKFIIDQNIRNALSVFLIIFFVAIWSNWHISVTYELDRYIMPWAVEIRVIFIISLLAIVDSIIRRDLIHED